MTAKKRSHKNQQSKTFLSESKKVFVLNDNLSPQVKNAFDGSSTEHYTAVDLGLTRDIDDPTLLKVFDSYTSAASAVGIVITSDRGRSDGVMPKAINNHPYLSLITTSIQQAANTKKAFEALLTVHRFKNPATYAKRFEKIHLSQDGSALVIHFKTKTSRQQEKRIVNVF